MKTKKLQIALTIGGALLVASCNPKPEAVLPNVDVKAEIAAVTLSSVTVDITVNAGVSFYEELIPADKYTYASADEAAAAIVAGIKKEVDAGKTTWAANLNIGSKKIVHKELKQGDAFKVVVFGLRGDGSISSAVTVLDTTIPVYTFEINIGNPTELGFAVTITPSILTADYIWFYIPDAALAMYGCETIEEYAEAGIADFIKQASWDDLVQGEMKFDYSPALDPATKYYVCCAGFDENHKLASNIYTASATTLMIEYDEEDNSDEKFSAGVAFRANGFVVGISPKKDYLTYSYTMDINHSEYGEFASPEAVEEAFIGVLQEEINAYWTIMATEYDSLDQFLTDMFYTPADYPILWNNLAAYDFYEQYFGAPAQAGDIISIYAFAIEPDAAGISESAVKFTDGAYIFEFEMPASAASAPALMPRDAHHNSFMKAPRCNKWTKFVK